MSEAKREPLFHISKRTDISCQKALLIRVIAIALALGASAIICLLLTDDSVRGDLCEVYGKLSAFRVKKS